MNFKLALKLASFVPIMGMRCQHDFFHEGWLSFEIFSVSYRNGFQRSCNNFIFTRVRGLGLS